MLEAWIPGFLDFFQIALLTAGIYTLARSLRGTRTAQILLGVGVLYSLVVGGASFLELDVVNVVLRWVSLFILLAMLVVFHPEIRRALARLGRNTWFQMLQGRIPRTPVDILVAAARSLANRHLGALLVVERFNSLDHLCDTGVILDARIDDGLLISIFTPPLPLHDGAAILRGNLIHAAHCILPIDNELSIEGTGTRHRAAVTLSLECDAVVIVISEERGQISVARDGTLLRNLSDRQLSRLLRAAFVSQEQQRDFFSAVFGEKHRIPWFLRPFVKLPQQEDSNE